MDRLYQIFLDARNNGTTLTLNIFYDIYITVETLEMELQEPRTFGLELQEPRTFGLETKGFACGKCDTLTDIIYVSGKVTAPYLSEPTLYYANVAKHYECCGLGNYQKSDEFLFKGDVQHPKYCVCHYFIRASAPDLTPVDTDN